MRVVSHSCSNTEIICALGCEHLLVGVDDHSDYPPAVVRRLARVGPDLDIDPERVAALQPDLVVASNTVPGHERVIARLQRHGLPLMVTAPQTIQDIATDMRNIAAALGVPKRGDRLAHHFLQRLQNSKANHAVASSEPVPVLIEWWPKPVIVPGRWSWATQLIEWAGGRNPWGDLPAASTTISTAQAQAAAPELIIMSWCGVASDKYRPHIVRRRSGWEHIPAVQNNQIHALSEAWLGRPGPRLVYGLEKLCQCLRSWSGQQPTVTQRL